MSPYNTNISTVKKWETVLKALVDNYGAEVRFESTNPHMDAYGVREAIKAAKKHQIEPFCNINYQFSEGTNEVICRPRHKTMEPSVSIYAPKEHIYVNAVSAFDVVEITTSKSDAPLLTFPSFQDDIESVRAWADSRGYVISSEKPLTLRKSG